MQLLHTLNTVINKIVGQVLTVVFGAMVVIIFAQVIFRYVLVMPLSWSEELARFLFVWATFLGASIAFYDNSHIRVSFFVDSVRNVRARGVVMLLADAFSIMFLTMYVTEGMTISSRILDMGQTSASMEWLSIGVVYLAIPIGSLCMLLNVLMYTLRHLNMVVTGQPMATPASAH